MDKTYKLESYSIGYTITEEMIEDKVSEAMADKYTTALAKSLGMTKDAVAASIIWEGRSPRTWEKEVDFE